MTKKVYHLGESRCPILLYGERGIRIICDIRSIGNWWPISHRDLNSKTYIGESHAHTTNIRPYECLPPFLFKSKYKALNSKRFLLTELKRFHHKDVPYPKLKYFLM